ncbi:PIG-L deacetylase family protein [Streptomyces sp. SM12]|uniref:PIG-L deacetylase family protein n=1 Tax=Streptomyces sp. SM12 TaxID=1071602 RepID=UPI000CD5551A|nr:PIG-L family deacetylase [Streptomyces sp. SM12]
MPEPRTTPERTTPEPTAPGTVVLSPHFDDAVLSLAGLLPRLPGPVTVVTVYGGPPPPQATASWWDSACGFADPAEAHTARDAEDTRACALLGAARVPLAHPDGPYGDGPDVTRLGQLTSHLAALPSGTTVLVPVGTNQPDHRAVRERALADLADLPSLTALLYADLPYTGHLPEWATTDAEAALARSEKWGTAFQEVQGRFDITPLHRLHVTGADWSRKREAVLCYGSQLAPVALDHGPFLATTGPLTTERVWSLTPKPATAP